MGSRIVLLDASEHAGLGLSSQLALCGCVFDLAHDLDDALRLVQADDVALVIIRAASHQAADYCRAVRAVSEHPLVFFCEQPEEALVVDCLEAGADSVVVAPLSRRELEARVRSWLDRPARFRPRTENRPVRSVGDLVIDGENHIVTKAGRSISLTPTEFRLLSSLARRAGGTVTHKELLADVWGVARVGAEHLRLYVKYLRQKLEDDCRQPTMLLNRRGVGYRLVASTTGLKEELS